MKMPNRKYRRYRQKTPAQWEKLLLLLLDGHEVTPQEIQTLLGQELVMNRFPAYVHELTLRTGAVIKRIKKGRTILSYRLENVDVLRSYALKRGLIDPPEVPLTANDLLVVTG